MGQTTPTTVLFSSLRLDRLIITLWKIMHSSASLTGGLVVQHHTEMESGTSLTMFESNHTGQSGYGMLYHFTELEETMEQST